LFKNIPQPIFQNAEVSLEWFLAAKAARPKIASGNPRRFGYIAPHAENITAMLFGNSFSPSS
jgi:hypothetical protein